MVITLVLNGDIKSCCSVTPAEVVKNTVQGWLSEKDTLVFINRENEEWVPDELAELAIQYFDTESFPLLYLNGKLAMFAGIPSKKNLLTMVNGDTEYGITKNDIIEAAKAMNLYTNSIKN
jgi:hypothetical protein